MAERDHSINIVPITQSVQGTVYNSYDNWHLVPKTKLYVEPSKVKTNYVDIPGSNGSLDFTELLSGLTYEDRSGTWEFYILNDENISNHNKFSSIVSAIHGKQCYVTLVDEPSYMYKGRLSVSKWDAGEHWSTATIEYRFEPFKFPTGADSEGVIPPWIWNSLWDTTIYYGPFSVVGSKNRILRNLNPDGFETPVDITIAAVNNMTISYTIDGETSVVELTPGFHENVFNLPCMSDTTVIFTGTGNVDVWYPRNEVQ